jgi:hypothetical protein
LVFYFLNLLMMIFFSSCYTGVSDIAIYGHEVTVESSDSYSNSEEIIVLFILLQIYVFL